MKITLGIKNITSETVARLCGGRCVGADAVSLTSVCTDSREANAGSVFCAIKGERVDGHDYIVKAAELGCSCFLCERIPEGASDVSGSFIVVDDTVAALGRLASNARKGRTYKTVAITGSVGKTTTKEFIASVFPKEKTYKTKGNFNSVIGLPMSLLELTEETEYAILEMGMSGRGEIESMSNTAGPDIAVITNIGTSHLEYLGTRENILAAKLEIVSGLKPGGVLLLNGDDEYLRHANVGVKKYKVGIVNSDCDVKAVNLKESVDGIVFDIVSPFGDLKDVFIPTVGRHNVYASLFAYASAKLSEFSNEDIIKRLGEFEKPKMRQNIFDLGGITIIEDCYNASPESMRAALDVLKTLVSEKPGARGVALLGNMLELGDGTVALHRGVGEYAAASGVTKLVTYGDLAVNIADGAGLEDTVSITDITRPELAADALMSFLRPGDILLVKASRGLTAEKIIEIIKERLK